MMSACDIHPTAIVAAGASLGVDVRIGPYCTVGPSVTLGDGVTLHGHVNVSGHTEIGPGCEVHPFAVLGGPPQHVGYRGEETRLKIGERNIIREHVTMNIGTRDGGGETCVGSDGFFMTGAHIGHDCTVGDRVIFANNATLGGHTIVEDHVFLGGLSAVHQHCRIGAYSFIGGCAAVIHDVIPFGSANGNYARLAGLNIIGMKRQGRSRETINALRAIFHHLFCGNEPFAVRLQSVPESLRAEDHVRRVLDFVSSERKRPLMMAAE